MKTKGAARRLAAAPTETIFRRDLPKHLPGYEPRESQVEFARAVERALDSGGRLIAEMPCGVGKSLAYLVPGALAATDPDRPRRLVVATSGITLQEQLVRKDLPLVRDLLAARGRKLTFALMKGISNYVCLAALGAEEAARPTGPRITDTDRKIRRWARETKTGDRSELPFEPHPATWRRYSVPSDECRGRACARHGECWAMRARGAARQADVVVTNYHMLFVDLVAGKMILPDYDLLVCDEAHKMPEIARDCLGWEVREGTIAHAVRLLSKTGRPAAQNLAIETVHAGTAFFHDLTDHMLSAAYRKRLRAPNAVPVQLWGPLVERLESTANEYRRAGRLGADDREIDLDRAGTEKRGEFAVAYRGAWNAAIRIRQAMEFDMAATGGAAPLGPPPCVYYLEDDGRGRAVLAMRPVSVAEDLHRDLFARDESNPDAVVLCSATLATGRGDFGFARAELGLADEDVEEIAAPSPFNLDEQLLLVVPETMPEPKGQDADWAEAVARHIVETIRRAGGRTLALFTSNRVLDRAYQAAANAQFPYRIYRQGDLPRRKLLEAFRDDVTACLFATASFWEGVDVQGESLSCVVIDRLPFPHLDDPVLDAVNEADPRGTFMKWSIPTAVIAFKQGFGRLIRSTTDRGVVVVLDQRILTARYGRYFVEAVGVDGLSQRMEDVANFLEVNDDRT